eukprot:scaffold12.g7933.t1
MSSNGGTPRAKAAKRQGRRVRALGDAFHRTVKWALRGVDEAQFAACFPSLPYYYVPVLFKAYREALHQARANSEAEFDACLEESRLADKLQDLEVMCEEQGVGDGGEAAAGGGAGAAPAPDDVLRALRHRALLRENEELAAQLEAQRQRLAELDAQLATLRQAAGAQREALARPVEALARVHEAGRLWSNRAAEAVPAC